jgi:hypothetical protein
MSHLGISAVRSRIAGLALSLSLLFSAAPMHAATVFDNFTGDTPESFGASFIAAAFAPNADFDFTGAAAFVQSRIDTPQSFTLALYSTASGGSPASALWTSDDLSVSAAGSLVGETYSGPAISLQSGVQYFVVLQDIGAVNWFVGGSIAVPVYTSGDGSSWTPEGLTALQFTVDGDPGAPPATPEASTWLMMLVGLVGLGLVGKHRRKIQALPREADLMNVEAP